MNTFSNNILNSINNIISYILATIIKQVKTQSLKICSFVKAYLINFKNYALVHAYYVYSNRAILNANGYSIKARSGIMDGRTLILMPIYVIISFLIVTSLFPTSMQQVTSAVTTSWSPAVSITYTQLLPILVILGIALHYIGIY